MGVCGQRKVNHTVAVRDGSHGTPTHLPTVLSLARQHDLSPAIRSYTWPTRAYIPSKGDSEMQLSEKMKRVMFVVATNLTLGTAVYAGSTCPDAIVPTNTVEGLCTNATGIWKCIPDIFSGDGGCKSPGHNPQKCNWFVGNYTSHTYAPIGCMSSGQMCQTTDTNPNTQVNVGHNYGICS